LAHKYYKRLEALHCKHCKFDNRNARLGFGLLFKYGDGVEQDCQKALEYYTTLVDRDITVGMLRLGLMYYYGKGVPVDYRKFFDLFKKN
jgi:TPR repeat protein